MATASASKPKLEDAEYRKWARNLVGKDWEIFWKEDEDGNEDEAMGIEVKAEPAAAAAAEDAADCTTTTASGQETAEEKKETKAGGAMDIEMNISDDNEQIEGSSVKVESEADSKQITEVKKEETNGADEDESQGSIIDDWYDGNILGIIDDETGPVGENGWKFRILFLGDETIYEVFLEPGKVRPSARGWVQRTIALLNPPTTAAGENKNNEEEDPNLPPETSTLSDQKHLEILKSKMVDSSIEYKNYNPTVSPLPSYSSFRRIQMLRFQLESQIYLREKLSRIENHSGKELFTDGVRNPTENYVNYVTQCCKDLVQSCSWYCDSWKLLFYYFGNTAASNGETNAPGGKNDDSDEKTQPADLGTLTFEELIKQYLEYGKNTLINATMIDINAAGPSNKRRQTLSPDAGSNNRRTKRRRKTSSTIVRSDEETNEKNKQLLAAASKLDTEILSKHHVDNFVKTIIENVYYKHIATLGNMLKSLSHLVVEPLASWKNEARRILGIANKGNDAYDLIIDKINTKGEGETKTTSSESQEVEVEEFFSDAQIEACLSAIRNNNVLSRFNLFDDVHKLHSKLGDIQKNEAKALALMTELASETKASGEERYDQIQDKILSGLKAISNEMDSPESTLYNIDPLSTKSSSFVITRGDLSKAIELRAWFVDVEYGFSVRERYSFLERLISKIEPTNTLPNPNDIPVLANIPQVFQRREALVKDALCYQSTAKSYASKLEKRENDLLAKLSPRVFPNSSTHLESLESILYHLKENPVLFLIEEKIAAKIDLIQWYNKANNMLGPAWVKDKTLLPFLDLKFLYEDLQNVLRGLSTTRKAIIDGLASDSRINDEICSFLSNKQFFNCEKTINEITTLYTSSSSWQKRSESILLCLQTHGNPNAGEAITSQKLPAMVDIKRIADLTTEYPKLRVDIPGFFEKLQRIQSDAFEWSQNLYTTMMDDNGSFADALSFIQKERDQRPKGIIIYPTRTVADSTVDFLAWYEKIKDETKLIAGELQQSSVGDDSREVPTIYSNLIIERLYPILADGSEALEIYCGTYVSSNEMLSQLKPNSDQCVEILEKRFRLRRTAKAPSRERINSNDLISSLFSLMGSKDQKEGFPLQLMIWVQWHLLVADFVSQPDNNEEVGLHRDQVRSLVQAKQLKAQNPFSSDLDLSDIPNTQILIQSKSTELIEFEKMVEEAQNAEATIKKSLTTSKELLRGALLEKAERIKEHLNNLKTMVSMLKARSQGAGGLSINGAFENPLERHIKYFTWLVRTLQYPVLHEGEASFSSSSEVNGVEQTRIPFNALVSIHERMPSEISEFSDPILCTLRVRELYTDAKRWQDEVSRTTLISNRGNKRRGATSDNAMQQDTKEEEKDAKISMKKMEMLAEDPILSKVDMPRHKAVKAMVDAKKEFEFQLESFLAQDFDGNQDNAPLPKGDSLVGQNGQFILYRLTGSSLFLLMQTSVQSLAAIGDKVFAETRGKAAFDWMRSAVIWIEELEDAVITQSKFTNPDEKLLVIPLKDAKELCKSGETIFLETTNKDVTQTLSNHGIYASVNSITKRLNVRLKKDGAHHSVGGIIIRWCPILFDALRADVARLESWEIGLEKIIGDFIAFVERSSGATVGEDNLYQWYCYHMKVQTALEEGQNTLVVSPTKEAIDSFTDVLSTIRKHLDKNCSLNVIQDFSKRLFSNSATLYGKRFELLDTLLYRREIADDVDNEAEEIPTAAHETKPSPRDLCRSNLEDALSKAAWVLNLESAGVSGVEDLCALKAWEIELEMFEAFQDENSNVLPEAYNAKAKSLKKILENESNIPVCLKILTDDMTTSALVKMTTAQLAHRLKLEKEKAKQAALKHDLMTSVGISRNDPDKPLKSILRIQKSALVIQKEASMSPEGKFKDKLKKGASETSAAFHSDMNADGAPTMDSDEEDSKPKATPAATTASIATGTKRKTRGTTRSPPPPPPPSLVSSFDTSDQKLSSIEPRISNPSGGENFRIELQGQTKYTFSAMFYQEDRSQTSVERFMSESLIQKGRSKIDDFTKFLSEKLRGGRWQATSLRLATVGDRDASVYKAFYKDFEAKERIAMFKLKDNSGGGKLFLVTPKFHHVAKRTRGIAFGNKNSTYAIVLTKKDDGETWN